MRATGPAVVVAAVVGLLVATGGLLTAAASPTAVGPPRSPSAPLATAALRRVLLPVLPQRVEGLGPDPLWRWENPRPDGHAVRAVALADERVGWAVGRAGAIVKTTDGGATLRAQLSGTGAHLLVVAAPSSSVAWAAGEDCPPALRGNCYGLFVRTDDGGATWPNPIRFGNTSRVQAMAAASPSVGWIAAVSSDYPDLGRAKILGTTDGGATWAVQSRGQASAVLGLAAGSPSAAWAVGRACAGDDPSSCRGAVLRTADGGATWAAQAPPAVPPLNAVAAASAAAAWAVGDAGTVLRTDDGGATWAAQPSGTGEDLLAVGAASPVAAWVVGRSGTVLATSDGGATWSRVTTTATRDLTAVAVRGATVWAVGADDGGATVRLVSRDGGATLTSVHPTTRGWALVDVAAPSPAAAWAVGRLCTTTAPFVSRGVVAHTADGGATWAEQAAPATRELVGVAAASPTVAWAIGTACEDAACRTAVLHTADGGATWARQAFEAPEPDGLAAVGGTAIAAASAEVAWALGRGAVLRTEDGGATWVVLRTAPPGPAPPYLDIAAVSPSAAWVVGSHCYDGGCANTFLRTADGGASWTLHETNGGGPTPGLTAVAPISATVAWAVGNDLSLGTGVGPSGIGSIVKTVDGGATFAVQLHGDRSLYAVAAASESVAWAVGEGLVLYTADGGATWTEQAATAQTLFGVAAASDRIVRAVGGDAILAGGPP